MSSTTTAQAWRYHKGGLLPNTLKLDEVEILPPAKGEVRLCFSSFNSLSFQIANFCFPSFCQILVDVTHATLNPVDYKIAERGE